MLGKTKILIVGAGKGGKALIELFYASQTVDIVGVVDINRAAPGIQLAEKLNIPTASDYRDFINKEGFDEIFNSTGSDEIQEDLIKAKPAGVEVIGGHSAKLIWDFIEERKKIEEQQRILIKEFNERQVLLEKQKREVEDSRRAIKNVAEDLMQSKQKLQEMQDQFIQAEKLSAVGRLASGVAHEVKNPLAIILQGVNFLENKVPSSEKGSLEILAMLKDNIKRADKIISGLLDFSKSTHLNLQPEDINSVLSSSLALVKNKFKVEHIEVVEEIKPDMPKVLIDRNKIEQVFINILINAIQAMPEGGKIIIRSYDKELSEIRNGVGKRAGDHFRVGERVAIIEFEDTGMGISEEDMKKIFDPFFTTKGPGGGTGLGLSVSQNILHMHKGLIFAESQLGKGTKITIILKIARR